MSNVKCRMSNAVAALRTEGRRTILRDIMQTNEPDNSRQSGAARPDPRERIDREAQRSYWNALSPEYSRITRIATDDFHYGPQIPGESVLKLLPPLPPANCADALELGCGGAQNSIWLSKRGWRCVAADVSEAQLRRARTLSSAAGAEIEFIRSGIEDFPEAANGRTFSLVHSSHALEFVEDPGRAVAAMAAMTRPGGMVVVSAVHPLFNGEWIEGDFEDADGGADVPAGAGLFLTDYFNPPDDVRNDGNGHVVSRAWPVSAWFEWFRMAGLAVERLLEPPATTAAPYTSDDWADHGGELDRIPSTIILTGRK